MEEDKDIYSAIIYTKDYFQVRLTINRFRSVEYLHLRKYYLDFDETWKPSKEGISMPLEIDSSQRLFSALVEILSLAESKDIIETHFKDLLQDIYQ